MERLEFGGTSRYIAIEAAIHTARYLTVQALTKGRDVLDVACGEGYGSWLMSEWGARSVLGVDVSPDAVAKAKSRFSSPNVEFAVGTAETLHLLVQERKFDLVVSLETIEHVDDPELFLRNIRSAAKVGATIVISAPNDYWYYDKGGNNEFHKRRFTFEEFQLLTEKVMGKATSWSLGTLGIGFAISTRGGALKSGDASTPQDLMLDYRPIDSGVYVPSQIESDATPAEAAFYVGVWGDDPIADTIFAGYPVSMNLGRQPLFPRDDIWAIKSDPQVAAKKAEKEAANAREVEMLKIRAEELNTKEREFAERERDLTELANTLQVSLDTANEKLHFAEEKLDTAHEQLVVAERELDTAIEQLHFAEKENGRLGMARRAAQAEIQSAWRSIWRHEEHARGYVATIESLQAEIADLRQHVAPIESMKTELAELHLTTTRQSGYIDELHRHSAEQTAAIETANGHLSGIPWTVVRSWWRVRKLIPAPVLRSIGRILNSMR